MRYKRLLITGGSGFIGTNFIIYLIKKKLDIKIVNIDKNTYASNKYLEGNINEYKNYS